ncbi:hypothetical protein [Vibrio cortegadensis]|uniref:hypothetical protein n=1 Tax=Vibrio cortegadensis TaxID=1328770 RepID=UPI0021C3A802|nr:hypothetical protein [Vibrio cortegadensis]
MEYAKVNRDQTNADLEKEIARLESLLPDEGDADTRVSHLMRSRKSKTSKLRSQNHSKRKRKQQNLRAKPHGQAFLKA